MVDANICMCRNMYNVCAHDEYVCACVCGQIRFIHVYHLFMCINCEAIRRVTNLASSYHCAAVASRCVVRCTTNHKRRCRRRRRRSALSTTTNTRHESQCTLCAQTYLLGHDDGAQPAAQLASFVINTCVCRVDSGIPAHRTRRKDEHRFISLQRWRTHSTTHTH